MITGIGERRRGVRASAAYPATLTDQRGKMVARGRTVNISEKGVFLLIHHGQVPSGKVLVAHLSVPSAARHGPATRTVSYSCHIVRTQMLGRMMGVGIEFNKKLA
ncbi:MAG: PilZ domain-containing protein [Phycisphaerae bacterium]